VSWQDLRNVVDDEERGGGRRLEVGGIRVSGGVGTNNKIERKSIQQHESSSCAKSSSTTAENPVVLFLILFFPHILFAKKRPNRSKTDSF
jgi:hypothetical protein